MMPTMEIFLGTMTITEKFLGGRRKIYMEALILVQVRNRHRLNQHGPSEDGGNLTD
jgi:hypothetical protein